MPKKRTTGDSLAVGHGPQLVWSGPEASGPRGDSRRVYEEPFTSAKRSHWVASYVYRNGPHVFDRLAKHLDATPGLDVTLVLNIERWSTEKKHKIKTGDHDLELACFPFDVSDVAGSVHAMMGELLR